MAWITIEEARENLAMWLKAEQAVATSQSYTIGGRSLTRANLADIQDRIDYWKNEIEKLESGRKGARVLRAVPMDW
jgi:hypothetical protein